MIIHYYEFKKVMKKQMLINILADYLHQIRMQDIIIYIFYALCNIVYALNIAYIFSAILMSPFYIIISKVLI